MTPECCRAAAPSVAMASSSFQAARLRRSTMLETARTWANGTPWIRHAYMKAAPSMLSTSGLNRSITRGNRCFVAVDGVHGDAVDRCEDSPARASGGGASLTSLPPLNGNSSSPSSSSCWMVRNASPSSAPSSDEPIGHDVDHGAGSRSVRSCRTRRGSAPRRTRSSTAAANTTTRWRPFRRR